MITSIQIDGLEKLSKGYGRSKDSINKELTEAVNRTLVIIAATAKINAPVKTGNLRKQISMKPASAQQGAISGIVGTKVGYAPFQEFGTRYFQGRFYFTKGLEEARKQAPSILKKALNNVTVEVSK